MMSAAAISTLIFTVTSFIRGKASIKAIKQTYPKYSLWQVLTHDIGNDQKAMEALKNISEYTYNQIMYHETFKKHIPGLAAFIPGIKGYEFGGKITFVDSSVCKDSGDAFNSSRISDVKEKTDLNLIEK